jgi:hypothetical protein
MILFVFNCALEFKSKYPPKKASLNFIQVKRGLYFIGSSECSSGQPSTFIVKSM